MTNCDMCGKALNNVITVNGYDDVRAKIVKFELCDRCLNKISRYIKFEAGRNEVKKAKKVLKGRCGNG